MFIVPALLVMGAAKTIDFISVGIFIGFISVFLSYQPAIELVRRFQRKTHVDLSALYWVLILGGVGSVFIVLPIIYYSKWQALYLGGVVVTALNIHLWLTMKKENMTVFGELFGIAGLTASAPLMSIYLMGSLKTTGLLIWCVSFLYFGGSVFYVKLAVQNKKENDQRTKPEKELLLYNGFIVIFLCGLIYFTGLSILIYFAFIPYIIKSLHSVFARNLIKQKPRQIGMKELVHSAYFLGAAILSFS